MTSIRKHFKIRTSLTLILGFTPAVTGSGMAVAAMFAPGGIAGQPSLFFGGIAVAITGTVAVMAIGSLMEWMGLID